MNDTEREARLERLTIEFDRWRRNTKSDPRAIEEVAADFATAEVARAGVTTEAERQLVEDALAMAEAWPQDTRQWWDQATKRFAATVDRVRAERKPREPEPRYRVTEQAYTGSLSVIDTLLGRKLSAEAVAAALNDHARREGGTT